MIWLTGGTAIRSILYIVEQLHCQFGRRVVDDQTLCLEANIIFSHLLLARLGAEVRFVTKFRILHDPSSLSGKPRNLQRHQASNKNLDSQPVLLPSLWCIYGFSSGDPQGLVLYFYQEGACCNRLDAPGMLRLQIGAT